MATACSAISSTPAVEWLMSRQKGRGRRPHEKMPIKRITLHFEHLLSLTAVAHRRNSTESPRVNRGVFGVTQAAAT